MLNTDFFRTKYRPDDNAAVTKAATMNSATGRVSLRHFFKIKTKLVWIFPGVYMFLLNFQIIAKSISESDLWSKRKYSENTDWEQLKASRNFKEVCGFLKKKTIYFELICCLKLSDVFLEVKMSWCLYWTARLRDRQVLKHPFWWPSDTSGTAAANDRRTVLVQTKS